MRTPFLLLLISSAATFGFQLQGPGCGAGIPLFAIDMRKVSAGSPMRQPLATRTIGALYDARFPSGYFSELIAPDTFDAMIFVDSTTRARPLR